MSGPAPIETADPGEASFDDSQVGEAAAYLKTLSHQGRLQILCHLCNKELSVSELESLLDIRQAAVSQMLARLRDELDRRLAREGRTDLAQNCFDFLPTRARLDLAGWPETDIFAH